MNPLFNQFKPFYNKLYKYLSGVKLEDIFVVDKSHIGTPYLMVAKGIDSEFDRLITNQNPSVRDMSLWFNMPNESFTLIQPCVFKSKLKGKWVKYNSGPHKSIKVPYIIYRFAKRNKLDVYHDNSFRNNPFYLYKDKECVGVAMGIRTL